MKMKYFYLALSLVLLTVACNKKPAASNSREDILRTGKWRLSSGKLTVNKPNGADTTLDYMKFIPDCYKDDYLVFDSLYYGRRFTGSSTCSPADPQYFVFNWHFKETQNLMDLYNGFNYLYVVADTVQPYRADTLQKEPVVLDTVVGYFDILNGVDTAIRLDTIYELRYSGLPIGQNVAGTPIGSYDIYNAVITNFSASSFTLNFDAKSWYPDTTHHHKGLPYSNPVIIREDTIHYSLIFTNF